jgi:hypothetical protein
LGQLIFNYHKQTEEIFGSKQMTKFLFIPLIERQNKCHLKGCTSTACTNITNEFYLQNNILLQDPRILGSWAM